MQKIYITFSNINFKQLMYCNCGVLSTGGVTRHTGPWIIIQLYRQGINSQTITDVNNYITSNIINSEK